MRKIWRVQAVLGLLCILASAHAAPPFDGTVWIDSDVILPNDATVLSEFRHQGQGTRRMMHVRNPDRWSTLNAHLYDAHYGNHRVEVQVNPRFPEPQARRLAGRYARMFGQMPAALREAVDEIEINPGEHSASGFNRSIYLYTDMMEADWNRDFAEEIIIHEAAHCFEGEHRDTDAWRNAQKADAEFISHHAERNPHQEDFAETFSAWTALRYTPDRLDSDSRALITSAIPHRLVYLDEAISDSDMAPMVRPRVHFVPFFAAADRTTPGFMRIVNRSGRAGTVTIVAIDDRGHHYEAVTLSIGAGEAKHFNAHDLERGNPEKGLDGHVGDHDGNWRLTLTTTLDIVPLAFLRGPNGVVVPVVVLTE